MYLTFHFIDYSEIIMILMNGLCFGLWHMFISNDLNMTPYLYLKNLCLKNL